MTTRKGCMLPPSSAAQEGHRRSPPATGKTTVSDEPPEDCAPIWVWAPGSSSPDVYLVRRKTPKSSALLPPPPAPVATTEPAPAPEPEVYLVKRKTPNPKSALMPAPAAPDPDPDAQPEAVMKRCRHCESSTTPQWREGPEGPATLCNACGVRHRQGRLLPEYRPRASPSFEPGLHASRHSEVLRLHRQRLQRDRIVERRRRRRAPPPEQRPGSEDDGGGSSSGGSGSGGDDEQLLQELPLPWRWHNSAGDPCPWCEQEQE